MKQDVVNLNAHGGDEILPNARRLIGALRQIGYSLEQAVSDLIDNSINANTASPDVYAISCSPIPGGQFSLAE